MERDERVEEGDLAFIQKVDKGGKRKGSRRGSMSRRESMSRRGSKKMSRKGSVITAGSDTGTGTQDADTDSEDAAGTKGSYYPGVGIVGDTVSDTQDAARKDSSATKEYMPTLELWASVSDSNTDAGAGDTESETRSMSPKKKKKYKKRKRFVSKLAKAVKEAMNR